MKHKTLGPLLSTLAFAGFISTNAFSEVSINGFASVNIGTAENDSGFLSYDTDINASPGSLAALQFRGDVNEQLDATVQLLASGGDSWDPSISWAYLSYYLDNQTIIRAGKMRTPTYSYTDFLDVRYAQPYLRPPTAVYGFAGVSEYTGVDAVIPFELNNSILKLQPYYGSSNIELLEGVNLSVTNFIGMNAIWEWNNLTLRGVYAAADVDTDLAALEDLLGDVRIDYYSVSARYDNSTWFVEAEYAVAETDSLFSDISGGFIGAGYRIGDVTPYVAFGISESIDDDDRDGTAYEDEPGLNFQHKEYSLGVRWDLMPGMAVKADITHWNDFGDTTGIIYGGGNETFEYDDVTFYTIGLDAVF